MVETFARVRDPPIGEGDALTADAAFTCRARHSIVNRIALELWRQFFRLALRAALRSCKKGD